MALGLLQGAVAVALILGLALPFLATWAPAVVAAVNASLLSPWFIQGFHLVAPWLSQIGLTIWDRLR
jgi:hypothetical protein